MRSLIKLSNLSPMLDKDGLRHFYPKTTRVVHNRHGSHVEEKAIIPPYVFIYATYDEIRQFKLQKDNISFIRVSSADSHTTMKVSDKEMADFIKVVEQREEKTRIYNAGEIELVRGQRIRIIGGNLDGVEGTLLKIKGVRDKRLVVNIPGVMFATSPVDKTFIQLL